MDFRQLNYVCTVAEYQSFTKAAKALFISQPSLSHFISKVEEDLGVKLFDRTTSPLTLTYAGEQYLELAREILRLGDKMNKAFRDLSQNMKGRIRVGIPSERAAFMLPEILPRYKKEYPGIDVQIYTSNSHNLIDALIKGRIDFMLTPYAIKDHSLESVTIYQEELLLVAASDALPTECLLKNSPNSVDLSKLQEWPFILLEKGHTVRGYVDQLFKPFKRPPNILMEASSNITAYRLAAANLGLAIVPRMTIELARTSHPAEVYSIGESPLIWSVKAVYRKDTYIGIAEKAFLDISTEVFSGFSIQAR